MTLTIYNVADAPNVVSKSLTNGSTITAQPVEPCDFLNPSFIINKSNAITDGNYIVAGTPLNRNYFIADKSLITGNRVLVSCSVDVLTTYANGIKSCIGTVLRAEHPKSKQIHDSKYPLVANMQTTSTLFEQTPFSAANGSNYLLTVVGGGNSGS